ncbi:SRPBCC domain-containing protein [Microbacterium awajiense]
MVELTDDVLVAAPADAVWHDVTDPASIAEWFWPERMDPHAEVEPVPGGVWSVSSDPAGMAVDATIVGLEPPNTLRLQWRWRGEEAVTEVEVSLDPITASGALGRTSIDPDLSKDASGSTRSTRVRVVHSGFTDEVDRDNHVQGWADCLQRLVERHGPPAASGDDS